MEIKRRTRAVIRTERTLTIRRLRPDTIVSCRECGEPMISPIDAAHANGISTRDIYRLIEAGRLPFLENEKMQIFVCAKCGDLTT